MKNSVLPITLALVLLVVVGGGAAYLLFGSEAPKPITDRTTVDDNAPNVRRTVRNPDGASSTHSISRNGSDTTGDQAAPTNPDGAKSNGRRNPPTDNETVKATQNQPKPPVKTEPKTSEPTAPVELTPEELEYLELDAVPPLEGSAAVYGKITMPDGAPAANVAVHLVLQAANRTASVASARTEVDGMFAIGAMDLISGAQGIDMNGTGLSPVTVQPGKYIVEARVLGAAMTPASVELSNGKLLRRDIKLDPDRVVTITLNCKNTDGRGVHQPQVTMIHRDGGFGGSSSSRFNTTGVSVGGVAAPIRPGESQTTIPAAPVRGRPELYTLAAKAMRQVELRIVQPGFRCVTPPGGIVQLDLSGGQDATVDLTFEPLEPGQLYEMNPPGTLAGALKPMPTGEASIRGRVIIHQRTATLIDTSVSIEQPGMRARQVKVDSDGYFQIGEIAQGDYDLKLTNTNFSSKPTRQVTVAARGEQYLEIEVNVDHLTLQIQGGQVDPIGGIFQLNSEFKQQMKYMVIETPSIGIGPVTEGLYWAEISKAGVVFTDAEADGSVYFDIEGKGGQVTRSFGVSKPGIVSYQIIDSQGYGRVGAEVRIVRDAWFTEYLEPTRRAGTAIDWRRTKYGATDSLGRGKIEGLPAGSYRLLIWTSSNDPNSWDRAVPVTVVAGQTVDAGRFGSR